MIIGNVGLISVVSTVILSLTVADGPNGIAVQVAALLAAATIIWLLSTNAAMDRAMCDWLGWLMERTGGIEPAPRNTLFVHRSGQTVVEYTAPTDCAFEPGMFELRVLAVNDLSVDPHQSSQEFKVKAGDTVLCVGNSQMLDVFEGHLCKEHTHGDDSLKPLAR